MNNVSLQLQKYRALKAQEAAAQSKDDNSIVERHPQITDYFRQLMTRWQAEHAETKLPATADTL